MYDDALIDVVLERLKGVFQDLLDHPTKGVLVLAAIMVIAIWLTRR